jgi:hypothetical protein
MGATKTTIGVGQSRLDHASLRGEQGASHPHDSIAIRGGSGERWAAAFRAVCAESTSQRAFQLNPRSGTVSFSCRTLEGPTLVFEMLERLESLLSLADRRVAAARPAVGTVASQATSPRKFA